MNVLDIQEQEDGSAVLSLELTDEEIEQFMKFGIITALTEYAEKIKAEDSKIEPR